MIEILAPVGGNEQLIAAVRSGADAVYLGTKNFNARRNALNFDSNELTAAVSYCHARGVRVHVTCNTLVTDSELGKLFSEIEMIAASGADAVIVQDMAAAAMFREHCPDMPLHASTQMTIHNAAGALMAEQLGFSRVVLARELSIEEIKKIHNKVDIELEVFVHGALCMSVSGQCYLSSMLGGRSGNRGLCAQPCRLDFKSDSRSYALSLKDLSAIGHIRELEEAGVCSLKIEGRMKRPEYVAAATTACREAVEGRTPNTSKLKAVFSRSGFTDGYLTGKRDINMFGVRTNEDVRASESVLGEIAASYRHERQSIGVDMDLEIHADARTRLKVSDGQHTFQVTGDIPETARNVGIDSGYTEKYLSRTGGTPFYLRRLNTDISENLYYSGSQLNLLRRDALEKLLETRAEVQSKAFIGSFKPVQAVKHTGLQRIRLRFEKKEQIFLKAGCAEYIYLPINEIDRELLEHFEDKIVAEMPRFISVFDEEKAEEKLSLLKKMGLQNCCAGNLGDIFIINKLGLNIFGGFSLNILNSYAADKYEKLGVRDLILSFELSMRDVEYTNVDKLGIVAYGYLPLMLFRSCPVKEKNGCAGCSGHEKLTDRKGKSFTVLCAGKEYSSLLNSLPLYIGDKDTPADFALLYYTIESSKRCEEVYDMFAEHLGFDSPRTNGLYYRTLL